jgi:hypothetical protein
MQREWVVKKQGAQRVGGPKAVSTKDWVIKKTGCTREQVVAKQDAQEIGIGCHKS